MRKINAKFNTAFLSEAGSCLRNKDYFAFVELDDFACYAIADGIDDDIELESAKIAVTSIIRQFSEKPSIKKRDVKGWLEIANKELLALNRTMRLKASMTVIVTDYTNMVYGLAGNTRVLLFNEGTLIHQSMDHSLSGKLLEEGKISTDKIATHIERNNLYCYLGQPEEFKPEISERIKLTEGDTITLLTRGIWENVDTGEITDAVSGAKEPQEVLDNVEELLLSKQPTKLENYTLATIFVDKIYQDPGKRRALIKKIAYAMIPLLLICAVAFAFYYNNQEHRKDQLCEMENHITTAKILLDEDNYARAADEYKAALDIAQKLKLPNEQKDLENYYKTVGLIVAGDMALQQKDYSKATEKYKAALDASYFADQLGVPYICKQLSLTNDYINFNELLQTGDQKAEKKDMIGARMAYLEAKVIASKIYYTEGRKEATERLAKLNGEMAENSKKDIEEGKKAKEQEAAIYEQQGNTMAQAGNYGGAVTMLSIASGMYDQCGKPDRSAAVHKKIAAIEDKLTAEEKQYVQGNLVKQGEQYEKEGDKLMAGLEDYNGALEQYGLALSLYDESGRKDKVVLVQKKIDNASVKKNNEEKLDLQHKAMDLERQGDIAAAQNQFDDARNSYYTAQYTYGSVGLSSNVALIQKKIETLDQKMTAVEQQKAKANAYVVDGDEKTQKGEYEQAKYLYLLAKEIYQKLGMQNEEGQVNGKLKVLTSLSKGAV